MKRNPEFFRACQNPSCSILNKLEVMEWSLQTSSVKGIAHIKTEGKKFLCVSPLHICFWQLMVILKNITRMIQLKMRFNWRCHWTVSDCFYYFPSTTPFFCCSAPWLAEHTAQITPLLSKKERDWLVVQHQSISPHPPPRVVVYSGGRTDQVGLSARGGGGGGECGRGR